MSIEGLELEDFIPQKNVESLQKGDTVLNKQTGEFFTVKKVHLDRVSADAEDNITMCKVELQGVKRGDRYEKAPDLEFSYPTGTAATIDMWVEPAKDPEPEPAPVKRWWQR